MPSINSFTFAHILNSIKGCIPPNQELYLVGGALRDELLGRESRDLDFVVPQHAIQLGRSIANELQADFYTLDEERDTGRIILPAEDGRRMVLDLAVFQGPTILEDQNARDFTLNSLAFDMHTEQMYDPLGGAQDIRSKKIRACSQDSIRDDPIRILRAVRQAVDLGFQIESDTLQSMRQSVSQLGVESAERLRDEIFRILDGRLAGSAFRVLEMLGVLPKILPELATLKDVEQPAPHIHNVWDHTLAVMNALEDILSSLAPDYNPERTGNFFTGLLVMRLGRYRKQFRSHFETALTAERSLRALVFFVALYHDVAKPECKVIDEDGRMRFWGHDERGAELAVLRAKALHMSNNEIERLRLIIRYHMRVHNYSSRMEGKGKTPSRKAIYRFFRDTGEAGVDLVLMALADTLATRGHMLSQENWSAVLDVCRILLENYWEKPQEIISPVSLLNGHEVMQELRIAPGPRVGAVLEAIREAQATGKVVTRESAAIFAHSWLEENNEPGVF